MRESLIGLLGVTVFGAFLTAGARALPNLWLSIPCFVVALLAAVALGFELRRRERARQLVRRITREVSAIIAHGRDIRGDAFTDVSWSAYTHWRDKTCAFLVIAFGPEARDLFMSDRYEHPESMGLVLGWRISALEELLRKRDQWEPRVTHRELSHAIDQRRAYTSAERIGIAGTPGENWAVGERPLAPIRISFDCEPEGVIQVSAGGDGEVLMTMTMNNAGSLDIEDMSIVLEVPYRFGLEVCDPDGAPSDVGEIKARRLAGVRQWQLEPYRLRGGGPTSFSFRLVLRDPNPDDLLKLSVRMPRYALMIQYEEVPIVRSVPLEAA